MHSLWPGPGQSANAAAHGQALSHGACVRVCVCERETASWVAIYPHCQAGRVHVHACVCVYTGVHARMYDRLLGSSSLSSLPGKACSRAVPPTVD